MFAFTRDEKHRRLARELGAVWAGAADEAPGGDPETRLDAAIIFAPAGELVIDALKVARQGRHGRHGRHLLVARAAIEYPLIYRERVIRSVTNSTRRDAAELLRLAAAIPITTEIQVFPLEQANEALVALKHDGIRGAAVLQVAP